MTEAFELMHMPTRESVNDAWTAIRAHFGLGGG
jgi:hypothetical protein